VWWTTNAIQNFLTEKNLIFFLFYSKADKLVKAVIKHLPGNASAEDTTVVLQKLDYDVMSVKQMTAKRPVPEGKGVTHTSLPFFVVTLERNKKCPENFKYTAL
jgi:hypothetical protein